MIIFCHFPQTSTVLWSKPLRPHSSAIYICHSFGKAYIQHYAQKLKCTFHQFENIKVIVLLCFKN